MTPALQYLFRTNSKDAPCRINASPKLPLKENTNMLKSFLKDETGAELAEYAVGVALLVAIGLVVYKVLGNSVNSSNSTTGSKINTAAYP
jgi:Flp pilus assembly pilin Flp